MAIKIKGVAKRQLITKWEDESKIIEELADFLRVKVAKEDPELWELYNSHKRNEKALLYFPSLFSLSTLVEFPKADLQFMN